MIVKLTASDKKRLEKLIADYDSKIRDSEALIERLRPGDKGPKRLSEEEFEKWLSEGSPEWMLARKENARLIGEKSDAINSFYVQIERREFSKLGGDREKIIRSAKDQIRLLIERRYDGYQRMIATRTTADGEPITAFSAHDLRVADDNQIYLDVAVLIQDCKRSLLNLYYEALSHDLDAIQELNDIVFTEIANSPKTASEKGILGAVIEFDDEEHSDAQIIRTNRPDAMLVPMSKLVHEAFLGDLIPGTGKRVNVQKKKLAKKSPVYSLISIDIDDMKTQGVSIQGRRELGAYDQEIHDAVISQYVVGGNEYITDSMIYDTISGKEGATLNPIQREAISNAITKLMFSHLFVDASEEAKKFGVNNFVYDGPLLPCERVTSTINGTVTECIHLFRTPPLYAYAEERDQIARIDIALLNSPVNKNEETIALQGYLYRRILSMKGSSKLSPTIKYETIYQKLEVKANTEGGLRKKKLKVRETVRKILDYWKTKDFIKGYVENSHKGERGKIDSITIRF